MHIASKSSSLSPKPMLQRFSPTAKLVFFVSAAVAPLTAVFAVTRVTLMFGNGLSLPIEFAIASLIVVRLAVCNSAIVRETGGLSGELK